MCATPALSQRDLLWAVSAHPCVYMSGWPSCVGRSFQVQPEKLKELVNWARGVSSGFFSSSFETQSNTMQAAVAMLLSFWHSFKGVLSIRAAPAQHGANIPISWPSPARLFAPFPPCFSDHHLVLSFWYCGAFSPWILCPWQESVPAQEQRPDQFWLVHVFFISLCSHTPTACWNIFPFTSSWMLTGEQWFFGNYFHDLFVCRGWNKQQSQWKCWPKAIPHCVWKVKM